MLNVDMRNTKLLVAMKGGETIVDGDLYKRIVVDDSFWTIEDGELVISMQKDNKMEWWKTVIQGDTEINTSKVQPENSKLGDLDAETRQTVEKMMFDQQQKAMGKPSSDELQKQEMLNKFMKAHPEMDFSQAKFS
jgi:murein L,D-transpeptidase YafK